MNVGPISNTNFKSRNQTLRDADKLIRHINNSFPRISTSKVFRYKNVNSFPDLKHRLVNTLDFKVRLEVNELYGNASNIVSKAFAFIQPVKKAKMGNCGESSHLTAIAAKINGIKDCHCADLFDLEGNDLDHTVLFVNGKKPYIIDTWLGFADYVPNALSKYQNEYQRFIKFQKEPPVFVARADDDFTDFLKNDFSEKAIRKILKKFPELKMN